MARNAHPEVTEQRIIDTARDLFMEQGYEQTTIQDIVDRLGDLSKGAIYHHFASKEAILDRLVSDNMHMLDKWRSIIIERTDLNALEKIREMCRLSTPGQDHYDLIRMSMPLLDAPNYFIENMHFWSHELPARWLPLVKEGMQDGSIPTEYPQEATEILCLLTSYWLVPYFFPVTAEQLKRRIECAAVILDAINVPLFDDEMKELALKLYSNITR